MSRSCQSATSSSAGTTAARTMRARPQRFSLRIGLRLWGIALEPFWPDGERLLGLADLAPLPVAHVRREPLDRRRDERERREERRVPIARDDLRRDRLGREAERRRARAASIVRREVRVRADRAGDLADRDLARAPPRGASAPRAISAWCPASARPKVTGSAKMPWLRPIIGVFACSRARFASAARSLSQRASEHVGRVAQQDRERRVEHVARRHPAVKPARLDARELLDVREERDDVVLRRPLDLVDARRVERDLLARGSPRPSRAGRAPLLPSPRTRRARPRARPRSGARATRARRSRRACSGGSRDARVAQVPRRAQGSASRSGAPVDGHRGAADVARRRRSGGTRPRPRPTAARPSGSGRPWASPRGWPACPSCSAGRRSPGPRDRRTSAATACASATTAAFDAAYAAAPALVAGCSTARASR